MAGTTYTESRKRAIKKYFENLSKAANTNKYGKIKFEYIDEKDVINLIKIPHGRTGQKYKIGLRE